MSWQWWVAQGFAFVGLIFIIISFQQKSNKKLMWHRSISTWIIFIGLFFLGEISAIIMFGASVIRNAVSMYFVYHPNTKKNWKYIASAIIVVLLIVLNIIFWKNYYNIFSIVLGTVNVYTYMQDTAKKVRISSLVAGVLATVYYSLLMSPVNIIIAVVSLIAAVGWNNKARY